MIRVSLFAMLVGLFFAQAGIAAEPWRELKKTGDIFELRKNRAQAAQKYERALRLVPSTDLNNKAIVEAELAVNLLELRQYEKAKPFCEDLIKTVANLRAANALDSDVLLGVSQVKEACSHVVPNKDLTYERRQRLGQTYHRIWIELSEASGNRRDDVIGRWLAYTRGFIALSEFENAEKALLKTLDKIGERHPQYETVRLDLAALQKRLKRPAMFSELSTKLKAKYGAAEAAVRLANAQYYVADHSGAKTTVDKALVALNDKEESMALEKAKLLEILAATRADYGDLEGLEKYLRQIVAVLSKNHKDTKEYRVSCEKLAKVLRMQGRKREADAFDSRHSDGVLKEYEFILTDSEREELKKLQMDKSK